MLSKKPFILSLLVAALLLSAAPHSRAEDGKPCCQPPAGASDKPGLAEVRKRLEDAVREAGENGGKAVSIDLDEDPARVQPGDLVQVNYVLTLEDGSLVGTTFAEAASDKGRKKSEAYREQQGFAPVEVVAGAPSEPPGIGDALAGMAAGGKKRVKISADKGYGPIDPAKRVTFPRIKSMPRTIRLSAAEYVQHFEGFPSPGKEVRLSPYVAGRVAEVGERDVKLEMVARDGERFEESFGSVTVGVDGEKVNLTLSPRSGARFEVESREGRVAVVDNDTFTVDFNHPLAGRDLLLDLEVVSLTKGSRLRMVTLPWQEDHDAGLAAARRENRPAVLVLYADWCNWCRKLFSESLEDPRVKNLRDRFVWVKVNSDRQKEYKARYGQSGFPLVLLLNADGSVAGKMDGFRDGAALAETLKKVLAQS
ncbi:MAG: thioredoxin family protein [Geobacteraceae bacterium]|nr:thioredoxin family protein [Geobacteraceae bacterium]